MKMPDSLKAVAAFYAAAAVSMLVLVATAVTWMLTMDDVHAALGLGPEPRAAIALAIGMALATIAGAVTVRTLGRRRSRRAAQRPLASLADGRS